MKHTKQGKAAILAFFLLLLISVPGCTGTEPVSATGYAMNTVINISLYGGDSADAGEILQALTKTEQRISWRDESSDIARINSAAGSGAAASVSGETIADLKNLMALSKASGGAFSALVGPLTQLWDIGGENQRVPTQEEIKETLELVSQSDLSFRDGGAVLSPEGASIDLGAAGKGIGCDTARAVCEQHPEITGAVVSVGGSIMMYGEKADGAPWEIGVRDPNGGQNDLIGNLKLEGGNVSTSGDYERYFEQDGVRYHHILDPADGYPADSGLRSVTVWQENGRLSDALSTACFVLGKEASLSLLQQYDAEALFIDVNGEITMTEGLEGKFTLTDRSGKYRVAGENGNE